MTTGHHLQALRVQLTVLHRELCALAVRAPRDYTAGFTQQDEYERRLDSLEQQLRLMRQRFAGLVWQGPAQYGYKVRDQVTAVEELIAKCVERFDESRAGQAHLGALRR